MRDDLRWLLVIDNADDPEQLRPLLPTLGPGHVLTKLLQAGALDPRLVALADQLAAEFPDA